jgi:chorismate mutase
MGFGMRSAPTLAAASAEPLDHLPALRARIDELDLGILRLMELRGRIVEDIGLHKQAAGIPVLDEVRERQLLERLRRLNQGPYEWHDVERVFRVILEISRGLARTRAEAGSVDRSRRLSPRQVTGNQA